ncbi:hypothetical protein KOR34_21470 [Posidoniimonas corsicana]|uniref:Uncharacterized protein n=1 Tax=Posidoniimonas corsicana TaxID=1938618 RepID=A0A5C5VGX9_9BACT|nr:hypothetical protein [Posidoniimonas corsicana]TWT37200.1 hypothetical protein KOR34_21470 [Posidoniimonas corsicana]
MGVHEAEAAMAALEASRCPFDYAKAHQYASSVYSYLIQKERQFPGSPSLPDISAGTTTLSPTLEARVETWMQSHPEYSPFMRTFARHYLISILAGSKGSDLYGHLAECVLEGGDFYIENGMFYLRDAAAVSKYSY